VTKTPQKSLESWLSAAYEIPRPECPPRDLLHRLAARDLEAEQTAAVQEHTRECRECRAEYDMALVWETEDAVAVDESAVAEIVARLQQGSPLRDDEQPQRLGARARVRVLVRGGFGWPLRLPVWQFAAAATVLLVLAVTSWPRPPVLPSAHDSTFRGNAVRAISPQHDVDVAPTRFVWELHSRAIEYRVRLLSVDDTVLWEEVTVDTSSSLPATVGASLMPMVRYTWTVEALNETGAPVAASEPQRFRIVAFATPSTKEQ